MTPTQTLMQPNSKIGKPVKKDMVVFINHLSRHSAALSRTVLLGLSLIAASGCANAETHVVEMLKYQFAPEEITIQVGDTVRWLNTERRQYHTIWFKDQGEDETPELFPEEFFEKMFDSAGDFPYICGPHHESHAMKGIVRVVP